MIFYEITWTTASTYINISKSTWSGNFATYWFIRSVKTRVTSTTATQLYFVVSDYGGYLSCAFVQLFMPTT